MILKWGGTEAERRRRENRGPQGSERGGNWGGGVRQRIFVIFEVHRALLVERTVPTKPVFLQKNPLNRRLGGVAPCLPPSEYAPGRWWAS